MLKLGILTFVSYMCVPHFTHAFFLIRWSVALILFWHTKGGSSDGLYHLYHTGGERTRSAAAPGSTTLQKCTSSELPPLQAATLLLWRRSDSKSGTCSVSSTQKLDSWFKFILHIATSEPTDSPRGSSSHASAGNVGCVLLPRGHSPRLC